MQQVVVILIVSACMVWLAVQGYRFLRPKAGGKKCAGGCCDGDVMKTSVPLSAAKDSAPAAPRTVMISSDDLRARLKARHS